MEHARQTFAAKPVARRPHQPSAAASTGGSAEADTIDGDIAERLKRLDHDQLMQVAEALGRQVDGADEGALRQSIADWVDEWTDDVAADWGDDDPEAARAAGRQEAINGLEEEVFRGLIDSETPGQWRETIGVLGRATAGAD